MISLYTKFPQHARHPRLIQSIFYATGVVLAASMLGLLLISPGFEYTIERSDRPTYVGVGLMMIAGCAYLALLWALSKGIRQSHLMIAMILFGVALRLMWVASTPIYEDDFYRYFFDGAMTISGLNPYLHAPVDILPGILPTDIDQALRQQNLDNIPSHSHDALTAIAQSGQVERVAYPYIRTIYPPLAQAIFALHHMVAPWSLEGWRLLLFFVDCLSLFLLFKLVQISGKSNWLVMVFWLNPLVITETMNAGHMDALLLPFLIGAALLVLAKKHAWAGIALAGAVGIKLWPIILAPIVFRVLLTKPFKLLLAVIPFALLVVLLLMPQVLARLDTTSGLAAYAEGWQVNTFLFAKFEQMLAFVVDGSNLLARISVFGLIILLVLWRAVKQGDQATVPMNMFIITAVLFLLSPTGYPWYLIWIIPWLVLYPSPALLLLTVSLPLYDLRYVLSDAVFNNFIVPIEFGPSLVWLAIDGLRRRRRGQGS